MRLLGIASAEEYVAWCVEHGFAKGLNKRSQALRKERDEVRRRAADARIAATREIDDPASALELAIDGTLDCDSIGRPDLRLACKVLSERKPRCPELKGFLRLVGGRGRFLLESETVGGHRLPYVAGVVSLNERRGQWLRPPEDWRPRSHNRRKQFTSLARHLLARVLRADLHGLRLAQA
jgi:hypothetical protein